MAGLTPKQKRFVAEYLIDLNATQAAIRAGYSARTANRIAAQNLSKLVITQAIAEAQKKRAEETHRTALDVLRDIQRVTVKAEDADDLKTALKGLELEGRHLGMFTDNVRQELTGRDGGPLKVEHEFGLSGLSYAELEALASKLAER